MAASVNEITFLVPGQPGVESLTGRGGSPRPVAEVQGTVKAAVRVSARRGAGDAVRIAARPGDDIVVLHIANGPALYLHPENARELMRAQVGDSGQAARGAVEPPIDGDVQVPARLSWRGLKPASAARGGEETVCAGHKMDGCSETWWTHFSITKRRFAVAVAPVDPVGDAQRCPQVHRLRPPRGDRWRRSVGAKMNAKDPVLGGRTQRDRLAAERLAKTDAAVLEADDRRRGRPCGRCRQARIRSAAGLRERRGSAGSAAPASPCRAPRAAARGCRRAASDRRRAGSLRGRPAGRAQTSALSVRWKPLVLALGLRMIRPAMSDPDAQPQQPHRKRGQRPPPASPHGEPLSISIASGRP